MMMIAPEHTHLQQPSNLELVESVGAIIIYLPPYACDLNPIEKQGRWSRKMFCPRGTVLITMP
jgi:transposase